MHIFLPLWLCYTLLVGSGYVAAKEGVTPTAIQSMLTPAAPAAPAK